MITLDVDTREYLRIAYRGDEPSAPEVALVPARPGDLPSRVAPQWLPAEYVDGEIRFLLGEPPFVFERGTYAIAVRYALGEEQPTRWAGWIRLR